MYYPYQICYYCYYHYHHHYHHYYYQNHHHQHNYFITIIIIIITIITGYLLINEIIIFIIIIILINNYHKLTFFHSYLFHHEIYGIHHISIGNTCFKITHHHFLQNNSRHHPESAIHFRAHKYCSLGFSMAGVKTLQQLLYTHDLELTKGKTERMCHLMSIFIQNLCHNLQIYI